MKRKGFISYGPSRVDAESLSCIMAEDLKPFDITVNILFPVGATETGMIPEEYKEEIKQHLDLLQPQIMDKPMKFLASDQSDEIAGERIIATDFVEWKEKYL